MTRQEEIGEGISGIELGVDDLCGVLEGHVHLTPQGSAKVVKYLHSEGAAIKVDRELPESPNADYLISQYDGEEATAEDVALMHLNGIEKGKSLMLKAGYVAVEPLTS